MWIRRFKLKDLSAVQSIVKARFDEVYDPRLLINYAHSWPNGFLVAKDNAVIGLLLGVLTAPKSARILILGVVKERERQRIGTRLLLAFIRQCMVKNVNTITLEVRVSNAAAIQFYKKFGFYVVNIIPDYYKDGEDGYLMRRTFI